MLMFHRETNLKTETTFTWSYYTDVKAIIKQFTLYLNPLILFIFLYKNLVWTVPFILDKNCENLHFVC